MLHTVAYSQVNKTASFFFRVGGGYNFVSDSPLIGCLKEILHIIIMQLFGNLWSSELLLLLLCYYDRSDALKKLKENYLHTHWIFSCCSIQVI